MRIVSLLVALALCLLMPMTALAAEVTEPVSPMSETTSETIAVITIEEVREVASDIVHADLFGSFLICGCIVAAVLFRRR